MAARPASPARVAIRTPQGSPLPCTLASLDGSLVLLEVLDSGSFGKVFLAKTTNGKLRAAKCVPMRIGPAGADASDQSPESEAEILKLVKHNNVIRLHDSKVIDGRLWLSMEFARHGNINKYLHTAARKNLTEEELAVVGQSMLRALKTLHKRGVIHRDVKPSNILIARDGKVKLGDLGTACLAAAKCNSVQGTFQYLAPEIFSEQRYDSKVDIWALGMSLLELAQGFNPFQSEHFARVLFHLVDAPAAPSLEDPTGHSNLFIDFLSKCLSLKSDARPTAAELLKHPFIKKAGKVLPTRGGQKGSASSSLATQCSPSVSSSSGAALTASTDSSPRLSPNSMSSMSSFSSNSAADSMRSSSEDDSEELSSLRSLQTIASKRPASNPPHTTPSFVVQLDLVHG